METLSKQIGDRKAENGALAAWWLGGSGFVFKAPDGTVLYVDPYLSNCVKEMFGVGRAFPSPIAAEDVRADAIISTHWHEDHLDPVSIPIIARSDPKTVFIMPPSALAHAIHVGVARNRIQTLATGGKLCIGAFTIHHVVARHEAGIPGWEVHDAMGVILEVANKRIYISGDTEYDTRLRQLKHNELDVAIVCINGVTGNMNAHEAALLAWQLNVGTLIPMHHYLWDGSAPADATLDPQLLVDTYARLGGKGRVILPQLGTEIII